MPLQEVTALLLRVRLGMSVFQAQGKAHVEHSARAQSYAQWGQQPGDGRTDGRCRSRATSARHVDVLTIRFAPPAAAVQQVTQAVETVTDAAALERLLGAAVRRASLAEFQAAIDTGGITS